MKTIPADRLAWLSTRTLYKGKHRGAGGPDCRHCALELLHAVIAGEIADAVPPGVTRFASILPFLNDGGWRDGDWLDDAHRTAVLRPYLPKFLPPALGGLDPAHDKCRVYRLIEQACREMAPAMLGLLGIEDEAIGLRALATIVDSTTGREAATECGHALRRARVRLHSRTRVPDFRLDPDFARARDFARGIAIALVVASDIGGYCDRGLAYGRDLTFARECARDLARDMDLAHLLTRDGNTTYSAEGVKKSSSWGWAVRAVLDTICKP